MINKVILVGRLVKEVELRKTTSGKSVCSGTIAVERDRKNENGEKEVDFIEFTAWEKKADFLSQYVKKGYLIGIVGKWQVRNYTAKDGTQRKVNECFIEDVQIIIGDKREDSKPPFMDEVVSKPSNSMPYPVDKDETPEEPTFNSLDDIDSLDDLPF